MRSSWLAILGILVLVGCVLFTLFPARWSPAPYQGILVGMAMYFVAFTRVAAARRAERGFVPSLFGPDGIVPLVALRATAFLAIFVGMAYVYFERRASYDVTWPVLILASWCLAEGLLRLRRRTVW